MNLLGRFRTNRKQRAAELDRMAEIQWRRQSTSRFDQLHISLGPDGITFQVKREGYPRVHEFAKAKTVERYIMGFYRGLRTGSGAPDDVFLDSLGKVS